MLKKNIQNLSCCKKTVVIENDVFNMKKLKMNFKSYELIFIDPPFQEIRIKSILNTIKEENILKKDSIVLIHRDKKTLDEFPENFKIIIDKKYGRSRILFGKFI